MDNTIAHYETADEMKYIVPGQIIGFTLGGIVVFAAAYHFYQWRKMRKAQIAEEQRQAAIVRMQTIQQRIEEEEYGVQQSAL